MEVILVVLNTFLINFLQVQCEYEVDIDPKFALVMPGQKFTVMCNVNVSIDYCQLKIPSSEHDAATVSSYANDIVRSIGNLEQGECGAAIETISEDNNGLINCTMGISYVNEEVSATMVLTVSKAPKLPILSITVENKETREFKAGQEILASCIVKEGRPLPKVTWFLDNEKLMPKLLPIIINEDNRGIQTIIQNITRKLGVLDNGKQLKCSVKHPAFPINEEVYIDFDIKFQPQPLDVPIEIFAQLRKSATITIGFQANPKPSIEWVFNNRTLKQGRADHSLMYKADLLVDKGRGNYEAKLRLISVSEEDIKTLFKLFASNPLGRTEYDVIISVTPDPLNLFSNYTS